MLEDDVILTDHEKQVLSALASTSDDGWLAHQLTGDTPPLFLRRWLAPAFLVVGLFVSIATFASWWWVGGLGLMLMGVGGWLMWRDSVQPVTHWLLEHRFQGPHGPRRSARDGLGL